MIALILLFVCITSCYAYDCVCPNRETFPVYVEPYMYSKDEQFTRTSDCLVAKAFFNQWYNVLIDGEIGYVNENDISVVKNCESTLNHRQERFLFNSWTNLFKSATQTMSCASICSVCWCKNLCAGTFCEPCGVLMCSKGSTTPGQVVTKSGQVVTTPGQVVTTTTDSPSSSTLRQIIATQVDPCSSNPCLNGGLCKAKGSVPECFCRSSSNLNIIFTGSRCELQINLAQSNKVTTGAPWMFIPGK